MCSREIKRQREERKRVVLFFQKDVPVLLPNNLIMNETDTIQTVDDSLD
jgi:hypothetical protein